MYVQVFQVLQNFGVTSIITGLYKKKIGLEIESFDYKCLQEELCCKLCVWNELQLKVNRVMALCTYGTSYTHVE